MVCLDSDMIINFLRNERTSVNKILALQEKDEFITTTSINEFEIWKGIERSNSEKKKEEIEQFFKDIEIFTFESKASKKAAEIFEDLRLKGEPIDELDVMISAIAITRNEPLLTNNKNHFERIKELTLLN